MGTTRAGTERNTRRGGPNGSIREYQGDQPSSTARSAFARVVPKEKGEKDRGSLLTGHFISGACRTLGRANLREWRQRFRGNVGYRKLPPGPSPSKRRRCRSERPVELSRRERPGVRLSVPPPRGAGPVEPSGGGSQTGSH